MKKKSEYLWRVVNLIKNKGVLNVLVPIVAVLLALLIGAGIILYMGENPIKAYYFLFSGA